MSDRGWIWASGLVLLLTSAACSAEGERASAAQTPAPAADQYSDGAQNVKLVGYNDLQGRTALVTTTKSDPANGNWVYIGHHDSFHDEKPLPNPITGKMEFNGTSILDISDPGQAEVRLAHSQSNEPEFAQYFSGLRLQVRRIRTRLPDPEFGSADARRDRQSI